MTRKVTYWVQKATYTVSPAVSNPGTLHTLSVVADWVCNIFTTPLMRLYTLHLLCFLSQIFTYNPFLLPDLMQDPCFILTSLLILFSFPFVLYTCLLFRGLTPGHHAWVHACSPSTSETDSQAFCRDPWWLVPLVTTHVPPSYLIERWHWHQLHCGPHHTVSTLSLFTACTLTCLYKCFRCVYSCFWLWILNKKV